MSNIIDGFYIKGQNHLDEKYFHDNMVSLLSTPPHERPLGQLFYVKQDETTSDGTEPSLYIFEGGIGNENLKKIHIDSITNDELTNRNLTDKSLSVKRVMDLLDMKATYDDVEMIKSILDKRFPFKLLSFTCSPTIAKKGSTHNIILNWRYDGLPTSQSLGRNSVYDTNVEVTESESYQYIYNDITQTTVFSLKYNNTPNPATSTINFVNPKYFGVLNSEPNTVSDILSLQETPLSISKFYSSSEVSPNKQYVCYAYPFNGFGGQITKITDGNGVLEYTDTFEFKVIEGVNDEKYYVYITKSPITASKFKYIFS